ncbi:hypothetical protein QIX46_17890 [Lysinibacillus boronitolerans]|nr:hypothetical protein QIX46_17890 [Lysinibacillus boronitolerans]
MPKNIKYINQQDKHLFHAFKSCGVLSQEHIYQYISKYRFKNLIKCGYIQSATCFSIVRNCTEYIYFLTNKGKSFTSKYCVLGEFYRSSSAKHDIEVANQYMSLPLEQRLTWHTEKELLNVLKRTLLSYEEKGLWVNAEEIRGLIQSQKISPTDGGYLLNEELKLVEIITTNYTFENVLAKCLFAEAIGCPIDIIKI